jgi:hypothetical protein
VLYEAKEKVEKLLERQQHVVEEVEKQNKKRLSPQEKRAVNITKKKPEELDLRNFSYVINRNQYFGPNLTKLTR